MFVPVCFLSHSQKLYSIQILSRYQGHNILWITDCKARRLHHTLKKNTWCKLKPAITWTKDQCRKYLNNYVLRKAHILRLWQNSGCCRGRARSPWTSRSHDTGENDASSLLWNSALTQDDWAHPVLTDLDTSTSKCPILGHQSPFSYTNPLSFCFHRWQPGGPSSIPHFGVLRGTNIWHTSSLTAYLGASTHPTLPVTDWLLPLGSSTPPWSFLLTLPLLPDLSLSQPESAALTRRMPRLWFFHLCCQYLWFCLEQLHSSGCSAFRVL